MESEYNATTAYPLALRQAYQAGLVALSDIERWRQRTLPGERPPDPPAPPPGSPIGN